MYLVVECPWKKQRLRQYAVDVKMKQCINAEHLLSEWLNSVGLATRVAYEKEFEKFSHWRKVSVEEAVEELLCKGKPFAESLSISYYTWLLTEKKLSYATVTRSRSAMRSLAQIACKHGFIEWTLIGALPNIGIPRTRRDTRGIDTSTVKLLRDTAVSQGGPKGLRDLVAIGLMYTLCLRRAELCALNVEDWNSRDGKLCVKLKQISVPPLIAREIDAYLTVREQPLHGPLFISCDRGKKGTGRLTESGLYAALRYLARRAGIKNLVSPQRLRHRGIDLHFDSYIEVATMLATALGAPEKRPLPPRKRQTTVFFGKRFTYEELSELFTIKKTLIKTRLSRGMPLEEAVLTPRYRRG